MTVKGGTSQSCAACKHQRRKCAADCPLAPYFPAEQPRQFQNAHRLFGVSNIVKILNKLEEPEQKAEAMRSILYEANIRSRYPVHGCLGVIAALQLQLQQAQLELDTINAQLAIHRSHHLHNQIPSPTIQLSSSSSSSPHEAAAANFLPFDTISTGILLAESSHNSGIQNDVNMLHLSCDQNYSNAGVGNLRGVAAQEVETHPFGMEMVSGVQQPKTEYDEISPFFDTIDEDRQSYTYSKEAYESNSETLPKDTMQMEHVTEKELKSAAACFTLTSIVI